jgi:rhodanese-related sulfurtransferase
MLSRLMQKAVGHHSVILIDAQTAKDMMDSVEVAVLDANPAHRWRAVHLPGADNVDPADYIRDQLPADEVTPLIFYCSGPGCGAAHYAARRAVNMGFRQVHVMTDGIAGWSSQGLPVESESSVQPGDRGSPVRALRLPRQGIGSHG